MSTSTPSPPQPPTQTTPPVAASSVALSQSPAALPPLNTVKSETTNDVPTGQPAISVRTSSVPSLGPYGSSIGPDSRVLNETLNVIDEHITDMRSVPSNGTLHLPTNDSGSEYSAPLDSRMSYIQGEETDEEEGGSHTREEVVAWTPDAVAEYLFTSGVEKHHCEVFRDQEISGEVLLGMDQSSLFIKAFDLGSVGRRLKTWHKIKALQDDVASTSGRRMTGTYGSDAGSEDVGRSRSRTNTLTHRPMSTQSKRLSTSQTPMIPGGRPMSPGQLHDSPTRPNHTKRPSAASIRDLHHSRRHSSTDYARRGSGAAGTTPHLTPTSTFPLNEGGHKKQPSFDRNWSLGNAFSQSPSRPLSSTGLHDIVAASDPDLQDSAVDLDRGYFSGTDADGRKRNVLRKRDSHHSKKSSYTEEQRVRSATAMSRHSRFGSMDSFRDSAVSPAAQKYFGVQQSAHRRTTSANTTESYRPPPPAKDAPPPTVTRLDGPGPTIPMRTPGSATTASSDWMSTVINKPAAKLPGLRAISDNITGEKPSISSPVDSVSRDHPLPSPARTGSSTPSGGPSFDLESPDAARFSSGQTTPSGRQARKKGKKETSAYTRGLQKIKPAEAMADAEYSGWMRKKSSNLMTTWKPRLFVLKGRRLAYYYSEDDDQERGLIDISFHRVLPADNEKLTGLHATITGAVPGLPGSGSGPKAEKGEKGDDTMFIFKLVPPRAGLSRAVNFTKPTVHYFCVPNLKEGRLWMAALMKATIDRDDSQPITSTYQQKTISLAKAKQMRHRPPALMNLEEAHDEDAHDHAPATAGAGANKNNGLGIFSEADSGVSGMDKLAGQPIESGGLNVDFGAAAPPQSA